MSSKSQTPQRTNRGHVSRILRLTLLARDIVEAILIGRQPAELQLDDLLAGFPLDWDGQRHGLWHEERFSSVRRSMRGWL